MKRLMAISRRKGAAVVAAVGLTAAVPVQAGPDAVIGTPPNVSNVVISAGRMTAANAAATLEGARAFVRIDGLPAIIRVSNGYVRVSFPNHPYLNSVKPVSQCVVANGCVMPPVGVMRLTLDGVTVYKDTSDILGFDYYHQATTVNLRTISSFSPWQQ